MNNIFTLEITTALSDGRGLGRLNGQAVLVENTLPGQIVQAELIKDHGRWVEAQVMEVLTASPWERKAPCEHAKSCGGCPWQALEYTKQLECKKIILQDALHKIAKLDLEVPAVIPSPNEYSYRNKMEFAVVQTSEGISLGLHQRRSPNIIPITNCLMHKISNKILSTMEILLRNLNLTAWDGNKGQVRFVIVRQPALGGLHIELILSKENAPKDLGKNLFRGLQQEFPYLTGLTITRRVHKLNIAYGEYLIYQTGELKEKVGDLTLTLGAQAFFQVNTPVATAFYQHIKSLLPKVSTLWDLYCGVGGIGLYIQPDELLGIDSQAESIALAKMNAINCHRAYHYKALQVSNLQLKALPQGISDNLRTPQVIVVDPPRAGLQTKDITLIKAAKPQTLIYVSCDPATLARDLLLLQPQYKIKSLQPFDLFPQTPHIETVCQLELTNL